MRFFSGETVVWPQFPKDVPSSRIFCCFAGVILSILGASYALGYWFSVPSDIVSLDILFSALSLYLVGYLSILLPSIWYFGTSSYGWVLLIYILELLLILLLISVKEQIVVRYKSISDVRPILSLFVAYVMAATCEETIKLMGYLVPLCVVKGLRTGYDAIFLAIVSGLSFATIENLLVGDSGVTVALGRFFWCTLTHTSDCVVGALALVYVKLGYCQKHRWGMYLLVLVAPICLHGTYNYVLFLSRDLDLSWVRYLSILVGLISVGIMLGLFWPLRRKSAPK